MRLRKKQRLTLALAAVSAIAVAAALILTALEENVAFFVTPSDLASGEVEPGPRFRIGGLVVEGSVVRSGAVTSFDLTDGAERVTVSFAGILPDLFREGQGIVALGGLGEAGSFVADEVLAKHDETYMPREVADALEEAGVWRGEQESGS